MRGDNPDNGVLAGRLLDRRSSHPLIGARLSCVSHTGAALFGKTDPAGEFAINLPEGVYDLAISARGYLSMLVRGLGVLTGHRVEIVRALVPGAGTDAQSESATSVGGFITDRLNKPIHQMIVELRSEAHKQTARTEKNGAYVFHGVPAGDYDLYFRNGDRALLKRALPIPSTKIFMRTDQKIDNL